MILILCPSEVFWQLIVSAAAVFQFLFEVNCNHKTLLKLRKRFPSPNWDNNPCVQRSFWPIPCYAPFPWETPAAALCGWYPCPGPCAHTQVTSSSTQPSPPASLLECFLQKSNTKNIQSILPVSPISHSFKISKQFILSQIFHLIPCL